MLTYKAELAGIKIIITEESYTSKASALDQDFLPLYVEKVDTELVLSAVEGRSRSCPKFSGKRIKRGLYKASNGYLINADVNGSLNIGRKVIPS